jgi:2-polyprenyl-3-methyl-5-hydroxy-6-metoxy-1,4-benzoquinol methylase
MSNLHTSCPVCQSTEIIRAKQFIIKNIWRCKSCSLAFFGQRASPAEIHDFYSKYPRDHYESPVTIMRYKELLQGFRVLTSGKKLIDYGCNSGFFLAVAKENGWDTVGAEISEEAREICRNRGLEVTDLEAFYNEYPPKSFDVILSSEVIEHMEFPAEFFKRAHELLKPGGILYVTTPNFDAFERKVLGDKYDIVNYPEHLCFFNKASLRKCGEQHGFTAHKITTTGFSLTRIRTSTKKSNEKYVSQTSTDEQIRVKTEKSFVLRLIKNALNTFLNLSNSGNSLKGWFRA